MMMIKVTNNNCGSGLREISLYSFDIVEFLSIFAKPRVELVARGVEKRNKKEWYSGLTIGIREFYDRLSFKKEEKFITYPNVSREEMIDRFIRHDFFLE